MAESITPRFGIHRQSLGSDNWPSRPGWETFRASLEELGAIYGQGFAADRPAAGVPGRFYCELDAGFLKYDTGTSWITVNPVGGSGAGAALVFGQVGVEGVGIRAARSDHTHSVPVSPVPAHVGLPDPHTQYVLDTDTRLADARLPSNDPALMHKATAETIPGAKTFTGTVQAALMRPVTDSGGSATESTPGAANQFKVIAGGPDAVFTCPPSGKVLIHIAAYLRSELAGAYAIAGIELRNGSVVNAGTVVASPGPEVVNASLHWIRAGAHKLFTLTPGSVYNAHIEFACATDNVSTWASHSTITAQPCL